MVQPGNLIRFQRRAFMLSLRCDIAGGSDVPLRWLRLIKPSLTPLPEVLILKEEEGLGIIFLFLRFEPIEHLGVTRIWVLHKESMWYVGVPTLVDVSYTKYVKRARPSKPVEDVVV